MSRSIHKLIYGSVWAFMPFSSQRFMEMLEPLVAFIIVCMIMETAGSLMHRAIV